MKLLILFLDIIICLKQYSCLSNVLFFIIDDLRPNLSCYGDQLAITPNIDQIAYNGILFHNAYAQQSLCSPSRTSLLTSRRPDSLDLYDADSYWRKSVGNYTSLPQYFKQNRYYTKSIGKVFHPGIVSNHSDDYPLSWSEPAFHGSTEKYKFAKVCPNSDGTFGVNLVCPVQVSSQPEGTLPDLQSTQHAIEFINNYNQTNPFFLAIGFHKPHIPLKYPKQFKDLFPIEKIELAKKRFYPFNLPQVAWNPFQDLCIRDDVKKLNLSFPFGYIPDEFQKQIIQSYYAATTYIDDLIGQILQSLERKSFTQNTLIVFLGDHGWSLGEHGEWSKYSNFDLALRVPFIISLPQNTTKFNYINIFETQYYDKQKLRKFKGNHIDHLIELVDLFPSLVELTGLPTLEICKKDLKEKTCTEGSSFKQIIFNKIHKIQKEANWKTAVFSQYPRPSIFPQENSDQPALKDIKIMGYTIKTKRLRYTEWVNFDNVNFTANWSNVVGRELYVDQDENENVVGDQKYHKIVKRLSRKLKKGWRGAIREKL